MRTVILSVLSFLLFACNNESSDVVKKGQKTLVDSLELDVNKGHIVGMSKMGKLNRYQQYVKGLRDSIDQLAATGQRGLMDFRLRLDSLQRQLDTADLVMNKWMAEYRPDSLKNDPETRAAYLNSEKIKIDTMVGLILLAIRNGDSLLPIAKPAKN
ncbi:MAG: hypothetical protein ABWZ25_19355 [Chitinophagaceae bacterium]